MNLLTANDVAGQYPSSYYAASCETLPEHSSAKGEISTDVCVVGGGYMGLSTALHLAERGYDVVLLEAQRIGFGASGRNGGQVGQGQRLEQDELEDLVGVPHARKLWKIGTAACQLVRDLAGSDDIQTPFHDGVVYTNHRKKFTADSKAYVEKLNDEYDYDAIRFLGTEEVRHLVGSDVYHSGTIDVKAGHVHPLAFAIGLARKAIKAGVQIFEQSCVLDIESGEPAIIKTANATIKTRYVVLGCNGYLGNLQPKVASRVMPINNYIVATEPLAPEMQESIIRNNHAVADSKFVVNYFRFSDDNRLLFGGGESYGYRFPSDIAAKVRKPMLEIFPQLASTRIDYAWGGTLGITMNRMPHYERISGNILSLSGFSGSGVAMATLSGQIAAEAIAGQAERFDLMANVPTPSFPGGVALRFPLLVAAMLWYSLRDRL